MKKLHTLSFVALIAICTSAIAAQLPRVTGITMTGDQLTWDAQEGATGYNVYLDYGYYDTVKSGTSYTVTQAGDYNVASFNDNGEFGVFRNADEAGSDLIVATYDGGSGPDSSESTDYSFDFNSPLLVYTTCKDVGPGETCVARCPNEHTVNFDSGYSQSYNIGYLMGGACSTSDIVEADAFIGHDSYRCTVPTYSGEVVAQAICNIF